MKILACAIHRQRVAVMFTLSSCTPENSDDTDTLLGEKLGSLIAGQWSAYCWDPKWIVIVDFSASGTYTSHQYYVEGNSEINGSEVSGDYMEDEGVFTGRWIISGNNVRFINEQPESMMGDNWEILTVSTNKFILTKKQDGYSDVMEFKRVGEGPVEDDQEDNKNDYDKELNPDGVIPASDDAGIYLGLSVNWADHNLGADDSYDVGGCYGWGDATGGRYSLDLSYYPSLTPPDCISGTKYDIVSEEWGNGWRMPTQDEIDELLEYCNWTKEPGGWKVKDTYLFHEIFIPESKIRVGKEYNNTSAYWTADLNTGDNGKANAFFPGDGKTGPLPRYYGLPVRPVKDIDYKYDPTDLSYSIDGVTYDMIYVEGNDKIESFYIMQTELPSNSYFQIGDDFIGFLDSDQNAVVSNNELRSFIQDLGLRTHIKFRLPTYDEWVYAAKGGKKSKNYKYSGSDSIDAVAWHQGNSVSKVHGVAQKSPNELNLYDMSGNYEEICVSPTPISYGKKWWDADGNVYGGSWKDNASKCTVNSWKAGNSSGADSDRITDKNGIKVSNKNAFDGRYITIRLVYSL